MSDVAILGVMCLVAGAFFATLVPVIVWIVRRSTAALEAQDRKLAAYAASRGLVFARRPPRARGTLSGALIEIGIALEGPHGHTRFRSRVGVVLPGPPGVGRFELRGRGPASALLGGPTVSTGDSAFDAQFALVADEPAVALAGLGPALRERLLRFPRDLRLERSAAGASLSWPGYEGDPAVLDEACAITLALADARSPG